jgi:hypothetical protein
VGKIVTIISDTRIRESSRLLTLAVEDGVMAEARVCPSPSSTVLGDKNTEETA